MFAVASLIAGLAAAISAWLFISIIYAPRTCRGISNKFELQHRKEMREANPTYKYFEPVIDEISEYLDNNENAKSVKFRDNLAASGNTLPWKASEFVASKYVESIVIGGGFIGFLMLLGFGMAGSGFLGVFMAAITYWVNISTIKRKSQKRRKQIKRSFAAAIDLMALMMEVGGSFLDSLKVVARENKGKPLGDELFSIVNDIELGKPRRQAMDSFANRMNDEDISEVIFACNESEELGVPLSETLKNQADRMRMKRSTWAESAAQEAEVSLVFPAMIIMLACLITVVAPFILSGLQVYAGVF